MGISVCYVLCAWLCLRLDLCLLLLGITGLSAYSADIYCTVRCLHFFFFSSFFWEGRVVLLCFK